MMILTTYLGFLPCNSKGTNVRKFEYGGQTLRMLYKNPDKDQVTVYLSYGSDRVEIKEQQQITTGYDFLAGLGGNVGMFLGLSVISVLWFIIDLVMSLIRKGFQKTIVDLKTNFWIYQ